MARNSATCPACGAKVPPTGVCAFCGGTALLEGVAGRLLPSDLRCPRCPDRPDLRGLEHEGIRADLCMGCHGVWFGLGLLEEALRTAAKRPPAPGEGDEGPAHGGVEPVRYARCPVCDGGMTRVALARKPLVIVDQCPAHGAWCDGGEFAQLTFVARTRGMEAIGPPPEEAPRKPGKRLPGGDLPLLDGDFKAGGPLFAPGLEDGPARRGFSWGGGRRGGPDLFDLLWSLFTS